MVFTLNKTWQTKGFTLQVGDILKPVAFKTELCPSIYVFKSLLKSIDALRVLELQKLVHRSLYDAAELAEIFFAPSSIHDPVKSPKVRGHYIRNHPSDIMMKMEKVGVDSV